MDDDTARGLLKEGAVVVVLDMPLGTEFGIDYTSWNVGPKFKGIKMVPPGVHFLYSSATTFAKASAASSASDDRGPAVVRPQTGPRTGFFRCFAPREVAVYRWDAALEDLVDAAAMSGPGGTCDADVAANVRASLPELDASLGAYPWDDALRRWVSLTTHLDAAAVARISPRSGKVTSVSMMAPAEAPAAAPAGDPAAKAPPPHQQQQQQLDLSWAPDSDGACHFVTVPQRPPAGLSPAEVTRCGVDRTYALEAVLAALHNGVCVVFFFWVPDSNPRFVCSFFYLARRDAAAGRAAVHLCGVSGGPGVRRV